MPTVPRYLHQEYGVDNFSLRGLSDAISTQAYATFFELGLLDPTVVQEFSGSLQRELTVALIWAMGREPSRVTLGVTPLLSHVPRCELALFCVNYLVLWPLRRGNGSLDDCRQGMVEWLEAFPLGRSWRPLLLFGVLWGDDDADELQFSPYAAKLVGPLLCERLDEPVDDAWLRDSADCVRWRHDVGPVDMLQLAANSLKEHGPSEWGVTPAQHSDLMA